MKKRILFAPLALGLMLMSCNNDDDATVTPVVTPQTSDLSVTLDGLEDLGSDYVYEGWIIVEGAPVSTGTFSISADTTYPLTFEVNAEQLAGASKFVLSIEPANDSDPAPADTKILAGDFSGDSATVGSEGIVADFSTSQGTFILATPTDGMDNNEESGVWFLDNSSGSPEAGLELPTLPAGWVYEGWAVMNGMPVSTGAFTANSGPDSNASSSPFKGGLSDGPPFPGEDFIQNAPMGLMFPTDLKGATIVVSVEPSPDNSPMPFALKPLAHMVAQDAALHTAIAMGAGPKVAVSGTVTR